MAGLAGEVEQEVLADEMRPQAVAVAHVGDVDADAVLDSLDVEPVAAVFRHQAVDQRDLGAQIDQPPGQVRTDKPQAAA